MGGESLSSAGASSKTPATPAAIVSALESCDRCRCSQIGGIFHTERHLKHIGVRLMWKVFCGKQLLNNYPSKIPAPGCVPKGLGHREQGFRMPGAETQVCWNLSFSWDQGFRATWNQDSRVPKTGTLHQVTESRDSGALRSWLHGNLRNP